MHRHHHDTVILLIHIVQIGIEGDFLEETVQPDGSVVMKIIKQYNQSPIGDYLN